MNSLENPNRDWIRYRRQYILHTVRAYRYVLPQMPLLQVLPPWTGFPIQVSEE